MLNTIGLGGFFNQIVILNGMKGLRPLLFVAVMVRFRHVGTSSACGTSVNPAVNKGRKKHFAILSLWKREIKRDFASYRNRWSNSQQISLTPSFPKRESTWFLCWIREGRMKHLGWSGYYVISAWCRRYLCAVSSHPPDSSVTPCDFQNDRRGSCLSLRVHSRRDGEAISIVLIDISFAFL